MERVRFLDNARALCALWIIAFWHLDDYLYAQYYNTPLGNLLTTGGLATFVFISGYCLGGKEIKNRKDCLAFYRRRIIRIYPLYALSCLLLYMMHIKLNINYIVDTKQFGLSLFGLSCIFPPAPSTIWFINVIIVYYAITPLIIWQKTFKRKIGVGILVGIGLNILVMGGADERLVFYFLFYYIGIISSGENKKADGIHIILLGISISLFGLLSFLTEHYVADGYILRILNAGSLVVILIESGKIISKCKKISKVLYLVSYSSMCAYLFHREFYGIFFNYAGSVPVWFAYCVLVPVLIVLAYWAQKMYDRLTGYYF